MYKYGSLTQQQLIQLSRPYYSDKRWNHIQQVLQQAKDIKQKQLNPLQLASIYMHDTQKKRLGNAGHQAAGAKLAGKLLKKNYTPAQLLVIVNAIKQHSPDYRKSIKNFQHSSPQAELLALADDSNNLRRDPDLLAMMSVKYQKNRPQQYPTMQSGYNKHIYFFGPMHGHPKLKWYADRWKDYAKQGIQNLDNYPKWKYSMLWDRMTTDTPVPDIDLLTPPLENK